MNGRPIKIAVIGGGRGLHAADIAVRGGASVTLFDAKPAAGISLVALRGGLNLTRMNQRSYS